MYRRDLRTVAVAVLAGYAIVVGVLLALALRSSPGAVAGDLDADGAGESVTVRAAPPAATFVVEPGMAADAIARGLAEAGVIGSERHFTVLVDYTGTGAELLHGCYVFDGRTPVAEVIRRLRGGVTNEPHFVIPEGLRLEEIGALLEEQGIATRAQWETAISGPRPEAALAERPEGASLLGYLLPASYPLGCGDSPPAAGDLVVAMIAAFEDQVAGDLREEAEASGLSLHAALTLASIVEREAILREEMPLIAAVFLNRLELGIALEADPTVQFATATARSGRDGWWPEIFEADLAFDSPYNTYVHAGLPPGPIAGPGIDAIRAVIRPAQTDSLYFVANCDGTDGHTFAETFEEHIVNVGLCRPP